MKTHVRNLCAVLVAIAGLPAFAVLSLLTAMPLEASGQTMSYDEIRDVLHANPPTTGDPALREEAILQLDVQLMPPGTPSLQYQTFATAMMADLAEELTLPIPSGARIWHMYNHGYIVKTPSSTFAFDLINDPRGYQLPTSVLEQIDVAFASHAHADHFGILSAQIAKLGGEVVTCYTLPAGSQATIRGLDVAAYFGLHNDPNNIFHVTTPEGLTIMHTGDTQDSIYLPDDVPTDILLINTWIGAIRYGIYRVEPDLTIRATARNCFTSRLTIFPYESALSIDDFPISGSLCVMVPGEHYDYNGVPGPAVLLPGKIDFEAPGYVVGQSIIGLDDWWDYRGSTAVVTADSLEGQKSVTLSGDVVSDALRHFNLGTTYDDGTVLSAKMMIDGSSPADSRAEFHFNAPGGVKTPAGIVATVGGNFFIFGLQDGQIVSPKGIDTGVPVVTDVVYLLEIELDLTNQMFDAYVTNLTDGDPRVSLGTAELWASREMLTYHPATTPTVASPSARAPGPWRPTTI